MLYGKKVKLSCRIIDALWYPSAGQQLLHIVVARWEGVEFPASPVLNELEEPAATGAHQV